MGPIKKINQNRIDMNKVKLSYSKLYKLKKEYREAANNRNEKEEQIKSIIFDREYNKIVKELYKLSKKEKEILDDMLDKLEILSDEKCKKTNQEEAR